MADSQKTLICPACGKEMEKVFVEDTKCYVDVCSNGCGGIFFDNREYKKVNASNKAVDELNSTLEGKEFKKVNTDSKRICPVCGMKMIKNSTSIKGDIIIDDCYGCGGKFLDCGELNKIRAEYETEEERSHDVMKYLRDNMGKEYDEMHAYNRVGNTKVPNFLKELLSKFL